MIWRTLYSALWTLATPLIRRYLRKRAKKAPAYLEHWDERFGQRVVPAATGAIWVHAVSVGETRAALPLVAALRRRWPDAPLLVTQMTPTGRATAEALYPDAEVRYLPYDYPRAVRAFLRSYRPRFGVLMETELWPNLIHAAHAQRVPLFLANARLSEKSLRGYRKVARLMAPALGQFRAIAAQTADDAGRLQQLGAVDVAVCGNTKYDFTAPEAALELGAAFRRRIGPRPVLVCASTRDGEEALILDAWRAAGRAVADALLVIVPRHPERFASVAGLAEAAGFAVQRRSDDAALRDTTQVWIGDSMGELFGYYAAADVAFVGGSLLPLGGQNLIEPASVGVPVLFGPSMFNFADASAKALASGAAVQVADAAALVQQALALLADPARRQSMRQAALGFTAAHRGASERIVALIAHGLERR
ncbi:3-deoxy-D-manno-octulosonic-acid transferase domain protein [Pseudogulbenkiania sp. NH8B]|uniref:lipid IV(A) 3-deoxy-D-manno-octulosonic acid transferase n=1 Tax=Pseudogulbenkiania sp. (strain NH8B) TaxID=748280 RepID=UPI000227A44E|nr:lipid IV(A) 3-deoxy-D-manno-octulosonic acid transferase [Pseudogulbenkiania sp. NH8B]BAK78766.1 3-deoxy-D-manno-octulosonic-acid transferase domain protein [Pseudogulbenkiania sp. NH8B]